MDSNLLSYFSQVLKSKRSRLMESDLHGLAYSMRESTEELSFYDNHPGDLASETMERSKDIALNENIDRDLKRVNNALEAIERGYYGKCDICGEDIDIKRLKAIPETTLCVRCSREYNN